MSDEDLNPAQAAELRFLRQRVDRLQDEQLAIRDKEIDIHQRIFQARQDLRRFVEELRQKGVNI